MSLYQVDSPVPLRSIREFEPFGVVAGITGRGESREAPFDLGLWEGERWKGTRANWERFRKAFARFPTVYSSRQCHGVEVEWVHLSNPEGGWRILHRIDGFLTADPGILLTVTVADCIPVYLLDPIRMTGGVLHAGWRGVADRILPRALTSMETRGSKISNILMHCGVGVCGSCYEVGSEVMDRLSLNRDGEGPWHADLRAVLRVQAERMGVGGVTVADTCSMEDTDGSFSHRRGGGGEGRMVAYWGLPGDGGGAADSHPV